VSPRISIADLAQWLHPRDAVWRPMALLRAYFDESGINADAPVTTIAGFVGGEAAWSKVEAVWAPVLGEYGDKGVKTFHMTDALGQDREFSAIDKPNLNYILTQLSKALGDSEVSSIFSGVVQDDWDAVVTDPDFLKRFPKPFDLCFDDIVRQLAIWASRKARGELVAPMFAYQQEYQSRMTDVTRAYGSEPWYARTLGPIAFGHPAQVIPLQGADMLAYEMAIDLKRRRYDSVFIGTRNVLDWMTGGRFTFGHWFDAEALKLTVKRYRETGEIYPMG